MGTQGTYQPDHPLGQEAGCAGLLHGNAQGQHAGDEKDGLPLDGTVGFLHGQAAGQDHQYDADQGGDGDGQPIKDHGREDDGHDP